MSDDPLSGFRPTRAEWLFQIAESVALRGTCSRLRVGALAVRGGQILAIGYNGAPRGMAHCDHTEAPEESCLVSVHAEVNVIACAARYGISLKDAELYVTHSPCQSCAGLLINAGIAEVHYSREFRDSFGITLLRLGDVKVSRRKD